MIKESKSSDLFFNDKKFADIYHAKSDREKCNVPGFHYYNKVYTFLKSHSKIGMKYIEFVKFACVKTDGKEYEFCEKHPWVGPVCERVPRPYPDYEQLPPYHYKHVSETPKEINGVPRSVNDFQPRARLKEAFSTKAIGMRKEETIEKFCKKYIEEKK